MKVTAPGGQDIAPGGSQKVLVSLSTRYFKETLLKVIEIETNDPATPHVSLTMKAAITEILSLSPLEVNFGNIKPGTESKRLITITNKGKVPMTVSKVTTSPAMVLSASQPSETKLAPGKSCTVELRFQPSRPDEYFFGLMNVTTDLENIQKSVRIKARIVKD